MATLTSVGTPEIKSGVMTLRLEAHGKQGNETIPWSFVEELAYRMEKVASARFDRYYAAVGYGVPFAHVVFLAQFVGPNQERLIP